MSTTSVQPYLPEIENARSVYTKFFSRKRASLSRWKHQTTEGLRGLCQKIPYIKVVYSQSVTSYFPHSSISLPSLHSQSSMFVLVASPSSEDISDWEGSTSVPNTVENLCAFCADPHIRQWFGHDRIRGSSDSKMDRISSMLSRRHTCIVCLIISTIIARRGDIDPNQDIYVKSTGWISNGWSYNGWSYNGWSSMFLVFMKGKNGDEEEIGIIGSREPLHYFPGVRRLYEPWKWGLQPILTLDPSVSNKIDWQVVKKWIQDSPEKDDLDHYPTDFRLIDVERLCVVRALKSCEYVCLSYVWGKDTSYQATLDTIHILEQPNSLGTWDSLEQRGKIESSDVPATIKDAIVACSALGKRYLWVDRLCIVQDEDEGNNPSKKEQINAMGRIYRCAFVTMVAMEGTGASNGLHGVSLNRTPHYRVRQNDYIQVWSMCNFFKPMYRSMWNQRGWTYQEAILSPRLLFFTKDGLWYEHDHMYWMKTDTQEWASAMNMTMPQFHRDGGLRYSSAVEMVTAREFGHEWDILDGFSGVVNSHFGKDHRFAIPLENFDYALLWRPLSPSMKRLSRGTAFPSWSWVSMKSQCLYRKTFRIMPVASWVFLDGNDIGQAYLPESEENTLDDIAFGSILWKNGCMIQPFPNNLHFEGRLGKYAKLFRKNWPTKEKFLEECRGIKRESQEGCSLLERFDEKQIAVGRKHGVVLGYSQAAVLTVGLHSHSYVDFNLYHGNRSIGETRYQLFSDYLETLKRLRRGTVEVEVVGLSASWFSKHDNWRDDDYIDLRTGTPEARPDELADPPKLEDSACKMNVMVIRTLHGISYRMGLGTVQFHEWLKLQRTFKAIVLQ